MKKLLFVLMAVVMPVLLFAQPMDTTTIYQENFDGASNSFVTSTALGGQANGDWRLAGVGISYPDWAHNYELYKSSPKCFHTPVYNTTGNSTATSGIIPLNTTGFAVNHVYLDFDHICKVHELDNATIFYQVAQGMDNDGNYNWGQWKQLIVSSNSDFYYGDAKSTTNAAFSGGKFKDGMYSIWNSNQITAVPNNTWWRHEMIDLSSFIFANGTTPTHFRVQFREAKQSPSTSGTHDCAGWYVDNVKVRLSNCELIPPRITMVAPFYYNVGNNFTNNVGPYTIKAKLTDNDTIAVNLVQFSYEINSGPTVVVPNTNAFSNVGFTTNGHNIDAQWELPSICYADTIYYHIYMEDTHGSKARFDTFLVAHHNYPNINQNDVRMDSLSSMPHCLITGVPQPISAYFTNRSDAAHSPATNGMTSGTFKLEVRNENGTVTHTSTHNWTGDICFDIPSSLSLGTFTPTHGYNYVTVYVQTRNGQNDGFHTNDTLRISPYACDSLMQGHYTIGGTNPDFVDIEAARVSLNYCGLGGPVVFHLRPGTYTDFDFTETYIGQSSVNTITFQGDDVNSVIITNSNTDAGANIFGAVTLVNVKDYIFKNLTIQGRNVATASRGVVVRGNGSTNILFDGCKITSYNLNSTDAVSSCVVRSTAATTYPDTIAFRNCVFQGGNFGINYVGSATRRNNILVDSCSFVSCYRAINTSFTNGQISHNNIHQHSTTNPQNFSGIYVGNVAGMDINGNTIDSIVKLDYGISLGGGIEIVRHIQLTLKWYKNLGPLFNEGKLASVGDAVVAAYKDTKNYQGIKVTLGIFF